MKKRIRLSILFGLICAILLSMTQFSVLCDDLRENVLRLHIVANSDDASDQALKLEIRDAILEETGQMFVGNNDVGDAKNLVGENLYLFEEIANRVIKEKGYSYNAKASIGKTFFETRHYDNFSLPAGEYEALIITLGKGQGKNWWCVIFPTICLPSASDSNLRESVSESSAKMAESSGKYVVRFKTIEIYEKIKRWFV